jgi:hypothetical protein
MNNPLDHRIFAGNAFTLLGKKYIQIGNAGKCEIALMPAETDEEKEMVQDLLRRFNGTIESK